MAIRDGGGMCLQGEVPRIEEPDLGVRDVAPERLRAGRQEKRVVAAPDGQQPRPVRAEVGLEVGAERHVAGIVYASSKAALDMLMQRYAAKPPGARRVLLLVAPGWVRTGMGGSEAALSVKESIPHVVDMTEANRGRAGLRYVGRFDQRVTW